MIYDDLERELAALGVAKPRPRTKPGQMIDRCIAVVADYEAGMRIQDIEAAHNIAPPQIYDHLHAAGVRLRRDTPEPPPMDELADAVARWGFSGAAEEYGVGVKRVRRWCAHYNITGGQDEQDD